MTRALLTNPGQALEKQLVGVVDLPKINVPNTTILKRAQVVDLSQDLKPRMGLERLRVQTIEPLDIESGPNGERVWKATNDTFDQIRFVGPWLNNIGGNSGQGAIVNNSAAYAEVVFYGTGLNLLFQASNSNTDIRISVDGGAEGGNVFPTSSPIGSVLDHRGYDPQLCIPLVSGLSLGLHTVKIRTNSNVASVYFTGFEVITISGTSPNVLQLTPGNSYWGGRVLSKTSASVDSYNSGFESGTLGIRGGRAVVYQKADGSIGKAVTPVNAAQANLTSADHTNEDVIRVFNYREFSAGRTDDFTTDGGTTDRGFTLDDNCTTLTCKDVDISFGNEGLRLGTLNGFIKFTFVGTGLDILRNDDANTANDTITVNVDGANVGSLSTAAPSTALRWEKIVSGLPYGSHTVLITFTVSGGSNRTRIRNFKTYMPKKPSIPTGAVELADYGIVADYVAGTDNLTIATSTMSTGIIFKSAMREMTYVGTWSATNFENYKSFIGFSTTTTSDYVEYSFYGTGIEFGVGNGSGTVTATFQLNGAALGTTGSPVATTGGTYTSGTSTLSLTTNCALQISGLTLGFHKIRMTAASVAGGLFLGGVGVITPIYTFRTNSPGTTSNALNISQGIGDNRQFADKSVLDIPNWAQAFGITASPTTTSTNPIAATDMTCTIKTTGKPITVSYSISSYNSAAGAGNVFFIFVNGTNVTQSVQSAFFNGSSNEAVTSLTAILPIGAGVHTVQIFWQVSSGTGTLEGTRRYMCVQEMS